MENKQSGDYNIVLMAGPGTGKLQERMRRLPPKRGSIKRQIFLAIDIAQRGRYHAIITVRGNDTDDDDSGIVATCHGVILAVVALIMSAAVSSAVLFALEIYGLPRRLWSWTNNAFETLLQHSLNGHVIIPVRDNDIDDDDSGIVATPDSNPVQGNDDIDDDDSGIVANPAQGNDRGYVQNISSLFATCHGAILAVVALIMSAPVSSTVRIFILFISALVSVAIIFDLVVNSYKEFSAKRGQRPLRNSLVANQWWVTQRIVLFLIFIMLSLCLLLASNRMLRLHHH